ncbi:MAG: hypothetical protein M1832_000294 [Thelocarpon impressellum]|nr:MAG: hypothetical protein M1832_000294 [Thelocarpon impressellum]
MAKFMAALMTGRPSHGLPRPLVLRPTHRPTHPPSRDEAFRGLRAQHFKSAQALHEARRQLRLAERDAAKLRAQHQATSTQNDARATALDGLRARTAELTTCLATVTDARDALRQELKGLQATHDEMRAQRDDLRAELLEVEREKAAQAKRADEAGRCLVRVRGERDAALESAGVWRGRYLEEKRRGLVF